MTSHELDASGRFARARRHLLPAVTLALFALLATAALHGGPLPGDEAVLASFEALDGAALEGLLTTADFLGGRNGLVVVLLAVFVLLRRRPRVIVRLAAFGIAVGLLEVVTKHAIGRPRPGVPADAFVGFRELGFPSGHALASAALYGVLALLSARHGPLGRTAPLAAGALLVLAVGASRLRLGAHWPSDVLAGFALGAACAAAAWPRIARAWPMDRGDGGEARQEASSAREVDG